MPKGFETCLLQVIFLFAFGWLSIACWSFFLFVSFLFFSRVTICVCVFNALIKGEIEDHVWFEDQWMVPSWCDEVLTMLCGLSLWLSIAGVGCGLTGVGAGEEQARKVIACGAARCGEDK
jgi:hypothetical protein